MLHKLFEIIIDRKTNPVKGSYTNLLFDSGRERINQKVGEEAVELVIAASAQSRQRVIEETSDLIYHLFVLLADQGIDLSEIEAELAQRHASKSKETD
ncbi:phosphoribosyl-ATP diphosphatase [bacterium]|nr:phosphoribosyl-ATP diphosphatase [bacterium]